ncbi:heme-binding protein [Sphingobacterium sp. HMA12]|uniref:GlcG/HbpS family heme-binding protein n=1 Tax=Sphingobacterium sp. HMA12 TaxID=2050894 RepID=UPI0018F8255D|nr:heme-binding protein [Sphingobacterium sp. HMA12]
MNNMTYHQAAQLLAASVKKANEIGIPVCIAIVDHGGHLMAMARLDAAFGIIDFAIKKAKTAIMFGVDSDVMGDIIAGAGIHSYGMINTNDGLMTIPGGVIIKDANGENIGAIGCSGGTPEQDKEIASAGNQIIL